MFPGPISEEVFIRNLQKFTSIEVILIDLS